MITPVGGLSWVHFDFPFFTSALFRDGVAARMEMLLWPLMWLGPS
jgi:hypothetical protein